MRMWCLMLSDEPVSGKVSYISPVLSSVTRTATVGVTIPNREMKLKPGMFGRVSISMPQATGVFVPVNALYRQQGTRRLSLCGRRPEPGHPPESHSWRIKGTLSGSQEIGADRYVVVDGKNKLDEGSPIEIVNK